MCTTGDSWKRKTGKSPPVLEPTPISSNEKKIKCRHIECSKCFATKHLRHKYEKRRTIRCTAECEGCTVAPEFPKTPSKPAELPDLISDNEEKIKKVGDCRRKRGN